MLSHRIFIDLLKALENRVYCGNSHWLGRTCCPIAAQDVEQIDYHPHGRSDDADQARKTQRPFRYMLKLVGVEFSGKSRNLGAHRIETVDGPPGGGAAVIRETGEAYVTAEETRGAERERQAIAQRLQARGIAPEIIAEVIG